MRPIGLGALAQLGVLLVAVLWLCGCRWRLIACAHIDEKRELEILARADAELPQHQSACWNGDQASCALVARLYRLGRGVQQSLTMSALYDKASLDEAAGQLHELERRCEVHDDRQACADAGWWYFWGRSRDDPLPSTEPDPARARQLLERACPYGSGERERRGCDDLAIVLLFTEPLSGGKGRAIALLERGCLHGATPPCAYLGLADELGLAGRARDPARALARYDEACNVWRVHVAWAGGRRGPVLRRPSTRNTVACFRLARRAERGGLGGRHHLEVAAQLYAEVCLYDHTLRLFPRACARASRLMLEYGFEHRYTSLERSPIVSGLTFTSTRARNPMAVEMAQVACRWGSLEGCALLRSIVLKGP